MKVGYPASPDTLSAPSLLRYYTLVKISKSEYFNNMLSARYCSSDFVLTFIEGVTQCK